MSTNLTKWAPEIASNISDIPTPLWRAAIRGAAIEFCELTWMWLYTFDAMNVEANTQVYELTVPADEYGEIISLDNMKYKQDGEDDDQYSTLEPISEIQMDANSSGNWRFITAPSPSAYFGNSNDKTKFALYPIPTDDSDEGLIVRVNLRPTAGCDTLEDFLYTEHRETIAYGALASLFGRKNMPWYDPQEAQQNYLKFRNACDNAKSARLTGPTNSRGPVKMAFFC